MDHDRAAKHAANEARLRSLNQDLAKHDHESGYDEVPLAFVCECFRPECGVHLQMDARSWGRVHEDRDQFIVAPGHEDVPEVEVVVERQPAWWVVRKLGVARDVARKVGAELTATKPHSALYPRRLDGN